MFIDFYFGKIVVLYVFPCLPASLCLILNSQLVNRDTRCYSVNNKYLKPLITRAGIKQLRLMYILFVFASSVNLLYILIDIYQSKFGLHGFLFIPSFFNIYLLFVLNGLKPSYNIFNGGHKVGTFYVLSSPPCFPRSCPILRYFMKVILERRRVHYFSTRVCKLYTV